MAKTTFVLFDDNAGAGYGDSGNPIDARAYTSGVLYVEANGYSSGSLAFALVEFDETTGTYTSIDNGVIAAPGGNRRIVTDLPGTHYRLEWTAPASGAHLTASFVLEDE